MFKTFVRAIAVCSSVLLAPPSALAHGHGFAYASPTYRSPGLAAGLSLTPLPADFGNLYAENFEWGVIYTAAEISLFVPAMWIAGRHMGGSHMGYSRQGDADAWTAHETRTMIGLCSGYIVVKIIAAFHAGYAARTFNEQHKVSAAIVPSRTGGMASMTLRF